MAEPDGLEGVTVTHSSEPSPNTQYHTWHCTKCGFEQEVRLGLQPGQGIISGVKFRCPKCGRWNVEQDKVHTVDRGPNGQLQWVIQQMSADELRELQKSLLAALANKDATADQVAAAVEPISSTLAKILKGFNDSAGLIAFITLVVTVIGILLPEFEKTGTPPPAPQVSNVIGQVQSGNTEKYPRNEKCYCGRNFNYKQCCGRHPTADPPPGWTPDAITKDPGLTHHAITKNPGQ